MSEARSNPEEGPLVGLALGEGTGPELADIFRETLAVLGRRFGAAVRVQASPATYATFTSQLAQDLPPGTIADRAESDAQHYRAWLEQLAADGGRALFRTAINAQTLYRVREMLLAVKVDRFETGEGEILLVRDQTQGFYGGTNNDADEPHVIRRVCEFSREKTGLVIDRALTLAAEAWGGRDRIDHVVMVCKFHLLENRFARWVAEHAARQGVTIQLLQPDTTNRNLGRGAFRGRVLIIGANEWSDIMDTELLTRFTAGAHDERFTRNLYLAPAAHGMVEYQTAHGSADDIAGLDRVNPTATLRAAAHLLQEHAGAAGACELLEDALDAARRADCITRDRGGRAGTREVVDFVLGHCAAESVSHAVPSAPQRVTPSDEALVLIDLQNEFCAPGGRFHKLGLIDPERTVAVAAQAQALLEAARRAGVPVLHVRTLYDAARLPPAVAARHAARGRAGALREGSWEASFFHVAPRPGEPLVGKSGYDAFLTSPLHELLRRLGATRLVLAGVFTDVCVDACARSAFQHGLQLTIASDATLPLERDQAECLRFMERYYDARHATAADLRANWLARTAPPAGRRPDHLDAATAGRT